MNNLKNSNSPSRLPMEPVGILGAGVEGQATLRYLRAHGVSNIEIRDARPVPDLPDDVGRIFGPGYEEHLSRFATLFKSPGIRPDRPEILAAAQRGTRITSAVSWFMDQCPCPVIGVTGTVGKGTASSLCAKALAESGFTVHLGGNIGTSPLDFLDFVQPNHRVVLEISSFQAMDISSSPHIGVILKTTTEHLDWHISESEYRTAKANLLRHQNPNDIVIFNADATHSKEIALTSAGRQFGFSLRRELPQGLFVRGNTFVFRNGDNESTLPIDINDVRLAGRFNLENVAAGLLAAMLAGAAKRPACRAAAEFEGLPHRLELVATSGGLRFYNDSYATRPDATIAAIQAFVDNPLGLILGGSEKNADFSELARQIRAAKHIRAIALIGATGCRLQTSLHQEGGWTGPLPICDTLEQAMTHVHSELSGDGVVLLSPACASFGMFRNYKERGEAFRQAAVQMAEG